MSDALLFPGQGSQEDGMRDEVVRHAPELLALACTTLGHDPFEAIELGTASLQPAIYMASIARWRALGAPDAPLLAGHSLGELAALVAGGALDAEQGLELVLHRGRLMQEAADASTPGGMLAVSGDPSSARALGVEHGLVVATDNAPRQIVLAGPATAVERARAGARAVGVRAVRLAVTAALHTPAMAPAVEAFEAIARRSALRRPTRTVLSCASVRPFGDDVAVELAAGIAACVRWREVVLTLHAAGATRYVDVGPGQVVAGLVAKTLSTPVPTAAGAAIG